MSEPLPDRVLLEQAIERFNTASSTLMNSYQTLQAQVRLLTEEVAHKKQLLNSILDSIDVGVVYFDADGTVQLMNRSAEGLLGISADRVLGTPSLPAVFSEEQVTCTDGRRFPAIISRSAVKNQSGLPTGSVLFFQDITRLKQLEAENERNRRLTAMGELITKIAHEIRNPLGSIELFASLLSKDLEGTPSASYAGRISNSVRHLVNTLDNMLRFSGGVRPVFAPLVLNVVLSELIDEFREVFLSSGIDLTLTSDEVYALQGDRVLLRQAFINILLNAFQAMPDGGTITMGIRQGEAGPVVAIRDSGTGMDQETASRLFEPFYSTKDRGTGLGMSIVAGIMEAHGAHIHVQSEPGAGTTVSIEFAKDHKAGS